jgi:hypothetical protein
MTSSLLHCVHSEECEAGAIVDCEEEGRCKDKGKSDLKRTKRKEGTRGIVIERGGRGRKVQNITRFQGNRKERGAKGTGINPGERHIERHRAPSE